MTDTDTTTQAGTTIAYTLPAVETKLEGALDTAKTDVAGDAKAAETDVETAQTTVKSAVSNASASAHTAIDHIEASGFVSNELEKAKTMLVHALTWIEEHVRKVGDAI